MFTHARFTSTLFAILLCAAAVSAQQNSAPSQPASATINLDVVVSPKSGPPVADLQQQDFTVLDNNVPQAITSFKAVTGREAPMEAIIVIDAVNTAYERVAYERTEIDKFLRAEGGRLAYPTALAVFTDKGVQMVQDFSTDGNALSASLDHDDIALRFINRSAGFYGAAERLQLSLKAFSQLVASESSRPGRKIMLWVSPGWPLLSGPRVEVDSKQQQQIFTDIVTLSAQLRQGRVTVYSVDPLGTSESLSRTSYYKDFLKGISKPSQVQVGNLGLQVIAIQSGGMALTFNNDVASLLQQCISDSAPYYEISFVPAPSDKPNEYHHLEIKLAKPGLTPRTRQGYYAQPARSN